MRKALEWLGGSVLVYVLMAACSGTGATSKSGPGASVGSGGGVANGGHDGQGGLGGGATGDPGDAGPVPNASAQVGGSSGSGGCVCEPYVPPAPTVVEAACDQQFAGSPSMWAVAEFPGKTVDELAGVRVLVEYPPALYSWPPDYEFQTGGYVVRPGFVAAGCGTVSAPATHALSVRFILP